MSNIPGADSDAVALHEEFAKPVSYLGAGLDQNSDPIDAVKSDVPADDFIGSGSTARKVSFEILKSALPQEPSKGDAITDAQSLEWSVIDITDRDDVDAWVVIVESSS